MATQQIKFPVSDGTDFTFSAPLDGVLYNFTFRRNVRLSSWFFSLSDSGGEPILSGARAVVDYDLLAHCGHEDQPVGQLILVDTASTHADPGPFDLGARVQMVFVTEEPENE